MHDDDMSDDEFDAFLNGTDALSRRLQALPQPSSSAQLDAAILARVESALAQENRAPAANDAVDNSPKLAPSFGRRWRIPTGIAASLLAGVIGHQTWQDSNSSQTVAIESMAEEAQVVTVNLQSPSAPPPPPPYVPDAVVTAQSAPAPAPPPVAAVAAARPEPVPELARQDDRAKREETEASAPPPPAPAPVMADAARELASGGAVPKPAAAAKAAPVAVLAEAKPVIDPPALARVRKADAVAQPEPAVWLASIDTMLKAQRNAEAVTEWRKFKVAYPAHPVAEELEARIKALEK